MPETDEKDASYRGVTSNSVHPGLRRLFPFASVSPWRCILRFRRFPILHYIFGMLARPRRAHTAYIVALAYPRLHYAQTLSSKCPLPDDPLSSRQRNHSSNTR